MSRDLDSRLIRWAVWTSPLIIVRARHLIWAAAERCCGPRSTDAMYTSDRVLFGAVSWRGQGVCA
eukprot:6070945-Prymnesium_polylepis.1